MLHQSCQLFYDDIAYDSYNGLVLDGSEGNHLAGQQIFSLRCRALAHQANLIMWMQVVS